jgi:hypothetical protein
MLVLQAIWFYLLSCTSSYLMIFFNEFSSHLPNMLSSLGSKHIIIKDYKRMKFHTWKELKKILFLKFKHHGLTIGGDAHSKFQGGHSSISQ